MSGGKCMKKLSKRLGLMIFALAGITSINMGLAVTSCNDLKIYIEPLHGITGREISFKLEGGDMKEWTKTKSVTLENTSDPSHLTPTSKKLEIYNQGNRIFLGSIGKNICGKHASGNITFSKETESQYFTISTRGRPNLHCVSVGGNHQCSKPVADEVFLTIAPK